MSTPSTLLSFKSLLLLALAMSVLACTPPPREDTALDNIRADLDDFRANSELSDLVPLQLADAERAVRAVADEGLDEAELSHRLLLAEKRLEIARASAFRAQAEAEIDALDSERTDLLLRASRIEVEQARRQAERAMMESTAAQEEAARTRRDAMTSEERREQAALREAAALEEAQAARNLAEAQASEIELARREADLAAQDADSLRRRLELMELRQTDRGVVVTLGDVLFAVGETQLEPTARGNLQDVVDLLQSEPDKRIRIEGHTDASGPAAVNQRISLERAESVRDTLIAMGIAAERIQATGMGEDFPIASNDDSDGRNRNRRVDVILLDD